MSDPDLAWAGATHQGGRSGSDPRHPRKKQAAAETLTTDSNPETWGKVLPMVTAPDAEAREAWEKASPHVRFWVGKSWLQRVGGSFGCIACSSVRGRPGDPAKEHLKQNSYSLGEVSILKAANAKRHQRSAGHRACVSLFLGLPADGALHAPGVESFRSVWAALREGQARGGELAQIGAKDKLLFMRDCLYHGLQSQDIAFFAQPGVICSLQRDERDNLLQVDYSACSPNLVVRSGTLGVAARKDESINVVTRKIIERAFRQSATGVARFLDAVHVICSDAAADEIRAAKDLGGTGRQTSSGQTLW